MMILGAQESDLSIRPRIPVGAANALLPLGFVSDVASGVVAAVVFGPRKGAIYNLAPATTDPMALWIQCILAAAGSDAELVRVPDETALAEDLGLTKAFSQPLVFSPTRARPGARVPRYGPRRGGTTFRSMASSKPAEGHLRRLRPR